MKTALTIAGAIVLIGAGSAAVGVGSCAQEWATAGYGRPVAEAGENQIYFVSSSKPMLIVLDASGSGQRSPDGGTVPAILSYEWSEGGAALASGRRVVLSFAAGSHFVALTVTDRTGAQSTDYVLVSIQVLSRPR